jgi:hypothetical protein
MASYPLMRTPSCLLFIASQKGMNAFLFAVENGQLNIATFFLDAKPELIHSRRHVRRNVALLLRTRFILLSILQLCI